MSGIHKYFVCYILHALLISFPFTGICQIKIDLEKEFERAKINEEAVILYQNKLSNHTTFISGTKYIINNTNVLGHPFFLDDEWQTGDIYLNGRVYYDIEMKLDIYRDVLVVNIEGNDLYYHNVTLAENFLTGIHFGNHYFLNIKQAEADLMNMRAGYYEQIYQAESTLLVKYRKTITTEIKFGRFPVEEYYADADIYLLSNGHISRINNKKTLLNAMSDHKKEIKRFIQSNSLKISTQDLQSIIDIAQFYDSLQS